MPENKIRGAWLKKLMEYVERQHGDDGCWFLKEPTKRFIRIPGSRLKIIKNELKAIRKGASESEVVLVSRAIFATIVGPIPKNHSLRSEDDCLKGCINPTHQALIPATRGSLALDLTLLIDALNDHYEALRRREEILPKGVTVETVKWVKRLMAVGNGVSATSAKCGLSAQTVMRMHNGVYDSAVENVSGHHEGDGVVQAPSQRGRRRGSDVDSYRDGLRQYAREFLDDVQGGQPIDQGHSQVITSVNPPHARVTEDDPMTAKTVETHVNPMENSSVLEARGSTPTNMVGSAKGTPKAPPVPLPQSESTGLFNPDGTPWEPPEVTDEEVWLHWNKSLV